MKQLFLLLIFGIVLGSLKISAQCNDQLIQLAVAEIGDATYLKDFKAKLQRQNPGEKRPMKLFTVVLNKGNHYRFNIKNAKEFPGEGIMELWDESNASSPELLGTNFSSRSERTYKAFDFVCQKTAQYKLYIAFKDGEEGCAVGLLSLVKE